MNRAKYILLLIASFSISVVYALPYYRNMPTGDWEMETRPFIYRQLSVWGIDFLQHVFHIEYGLASLLFMAMMGVFFVSAFVFMLNSFHQSKHNEIIALLTLSVYSALFMFHQKPYDLATAGFFALLIGLMQIHRLSWFLFIFLLSSINRETTILITGVFAVYFYKRMELTSFLKTILAQIVIFVIVQVVIRYWFSGVEGSSFWFALNHNVIAYLENPIRLMIDMGVLMIILWQALRMPTILRVSVLTLTPVLVALYIVCGQAFEYRVFTEVFPATAIMMIKTQNDLPTQP